jgi:hypothetical protein
MKALKQEETITEICDLRPLKSADLLRRAPTVEVALAST